MRHFHSLKHGIGHTTFALGLFILVFSFLAVACGADAAAGSANSTRVPPVQTTTSIANNGTSQGCPGNAVVTSPPQANVTVSNSSKDTTITAHPGDVIEFRFSFGRKWGGPTSSLGDLDLLGPAGYASQTNGACVWDFRAKGTGTTTVTFNSQALCKRGQLCPLSIIVLSFTVQVK